MEFCREPALFHFNSKPLRQQIFNLGATPESPLNLTVSPIPMVSIWTEGSGDAWSYYLSAWDNHNWKAKGKMTYFIWILWEALARDATQTQDYLVTQVLGYHTAPPPSQSLSQSVLYSLYSGSVYWGLSLNWAWDRAMEWLNSELDRKLWLLNPKWESLHLTSCYNLNISHFYFWHFFNKGTWCKTYLSL